MQPCAKPPCMPTWCETVPVGNSAVCSCVSPLFPPTRSSQVTCAVQFEYEIDAVDDWSKDAQELFAVTNTPLSPVDDKCSKLSPDDEDSPAFERCMTALQKQVRTATVRVKARDVKRGFTLTFPEVAAYTDLWKDNQGEP